MANKLPLVSVITVNYNGKGLLKGCFDSLAGLDYPNERLEIFMVDNGSSDDSIAYVNDCYPKIKVVKNDINNYCRANNLAISKSKGEL